MYIMSDNHLNVQLGKLQAILGKKVFLDPCDKIDNRVAPSSTRRNPAYHWEEELAGLKMSPNDETEAGSAREEGPMTNLTTSPYKEIDSTTLKAGEAVNEEIALCPWETVVQYPARFIGKANKPRVHREIG
jgi:hypothetical protein